VVDVSNKIKIKKLGLSDYTETWQAMKEFTKNRTPEMLDELWILEHRPVFTLGTNGKPEHILDAGDTPIVKIDRGGQVTYHGPGQLVIYLLLNLHRRKLGVRKLVSIIEDSIIKLLANYNVVATSNPKAPGVYVEEKKIAALGLRVSRGFTTHGLSLNVDMDLSPFTRINPCGYENLEVIQCKSLGINSTLPKLADELVTLLKEQLSLPVEN
jgi:lipoyl(octanoyl) transferase